MLAVNHLVRNGFMYKPRKSKRLGNVYTMPLWMIRDKKKILRRQFHSVVKEIVEEFENFSFDRTLELYKE